MQHKQETARLSSFLLRSPTPFHATELCRQELQAAGFRQLRESESWEGLGQPGQGFFCLRGGSFAAWICGQKTPTDCGLRLAAAHTDSPALKLKLESAHFADGVLIANVLVYGSPLLGTWCDRSLGVAGIVVQAASKTKKRHTRLVHSKRPLAIIPNLAIHLNREVNSKQSYNPQTQVQAIFGPIPQHDEESGSSTVIAKAMLRQRLSLEQEEVAELQLCSMQSPQLLGLRQELFSSARLDNASMVYLLLRALLELQGADCAPPAYWPVVICCNGEEVGSKTYEGAASNFAASVLQRLTLAQANTPGTASEESWAQVRSRSFLLSLDGAHASHPAYPEAYDPNCSLKLGRGPAIKLAGNASYTSEPHSIAFIRSIAGAAAERSGCPLQLAIPRSDKPTGSTIGPILCSQLGIRGVDIGLPMYAMHSLQETIAINDYFALQNLVQEYFSPSSQR